MTVVDPLVRPAIIDEPEVAAAVEEALSTQSVPTDLAIVAMVGRFPGADSVEELWQMLCEGGSGIVDVSPEEVTARGGAARLGHPAHVARAASLRGHQEFDAEFFGIPAYEAAVIDPQQRLFLEVAWQALQESGLGGRTGTLRIGVFASTTASTYLIGPLRRAGMWVDDEISHPVLMGNDKDFLCSRVSYALGLTGPSVVVQSACSGSLTALHVARQAILNGECDVAVVGGVSVSLPHLGGYVHQEGGILSPDGRCRVFDESAAGTVKGNGVAAIVLRPLSDAVADRDTVHAILAGTAVNNDGNSKAGYAAPGVAGQAAVIRHALAASGVPASQIAYVEAHGTGTRIGDPIELQALARAHAEDDGAPDHCWVGSVKAAIGHLDAAAGIAGLIKAALVLREQTVPVQVSFDRANPLLGLDAGPYEVPRRTVRPTRPMAAAAVSSFGLGGTNAHAILLRSDPVVRREPDSGPVVVLLSARDEQALRERADELARYLDLRRDVRLDDLALSFAAGPHHARRVALAASDVDELTTALRAVAAGDLTGTAGGGDEWAAGGPAPDEAQGALGDLRHAHRIPVPVHPLRRTTHWIDGPVTTDEPAGPPTRAGLTSSTATVEEVVLAAVRAELPGVEVGLDADLLDIGVDSLAAIGMLTRLRDELRTELTFTQLVQAGTVRGVAALCAARPGRAPASCLSTLRAGTADDLFLVHPAGGTTLCYVELASGLPAGLAVHGIAYPDGLAGSRPTLRALAARYVEEVRRVQPHGPYRLGGYSFGGNVAVEMAVQLEAAGQDVRTVLLIDSHVPLAYVGGRATEEDYRAAFPDLLRRLFPSLAGRPDPVATAVRDMVREMAEGTDVGWNDTMIDQLHAFYEIWIDNHAGLKGWYPDRPLRASLHVLEAEEPEPPTVLDLLGITEHPATAWSDHTTGAVIVTPVPGDHYSLIRDPRHLRRVVAAVTGALDE